LIVFQPLKEVKKNVKNVNSATLILQQAHFPFLISYMQVEPCWESASREYTKISVINPVMLKDN